MHSFKESVLNTLRSVVSYLRTLKFLSVVWEVLEYFRNSDRLVQTLRQSSASMDTGVKDFVLIQRILEEERARRLNAIQGDKG